MTIRSQFNIRKAALVSGETLVFRNAVLEDAEFIISLRTDKVKSRYLSQTSGDIEVQRNWLEMYQQDDEQAYFIIEFDQEPIGTIRLYDAKADSFCWGSWILKDGRPRYAAMESALMVYSYGYTHLGFKNSHFDVRRDNNRVCEFHERFGATRTDQNSSDYFYRMDSHAIAIALKKFERFLPNPVSVEYL